MTWYNRISLVWVITSEKPTGETDYSFTPQPDRQKALKDHKRYYPRNRCRKIIKIDSPEGKQALKRLDHEREKIVKTQIDHD